MKYATCHPDKKHHAYGKCRECYQHDYQIGYWEKNKDRWLSRKKQRMYGVDFESQLKAQNGICVICRSSEDLVVDHNHETGMFRAIICRRCNVALGMVGDSIEILEKMIQYLQQ